MIFGLEGLARVMICLRGHAVFVNQLEKPSYLPLAVDDAKVKFVPTQLFD